MDPPKRERKRMVNYAENEYYRQALAKREYGPRTTGPRLPKMPQLQVGPRPASSCLTFCMGSAPPSRSASAP